MVIKLLTSYWLIKIFFVVFARAIKKHCYSHVNMNDASKLTDNNMLLEKTEIRLFTKCDRLSYFFLMTLIYFLFFSITSYQAFYKKIPVCSFIM